jgi:predicted ribosomally synthesized peptide with nif11-like leader
MSKESLDQFMNQVADSEELQARFGDEMDADSLIVLGAEHGCEFTVDDLTAGGAELSDEELDGVAGGATAIEYGLIAAFKARYRINIGPSKHEDAE